jgi:hypothetical protein
MITVEIIHTLALIYWQNSNVASVFHNKMAAEEVVFRDEKIYFIKEEILKGK